MCSLLRQSSLWPLLWWFHVFPLCYWSSWSQRSETCVSSALEWLWWQSPHPQAASQTAGHAQHLQLSSVHAGASQTTLGRSTYRSQATNKQSARPNLATPGCFSPANPLSPSVNRDWNSLVFSCIVKSLLQHKPDREVKCEFNNFLHMCKNSKSASPLVSRPANRLQKPCLRPFSAAIGVRTTSTRHG